MLIHFHFPLICVAQICHHLCIIILLDLYVISASNVSLSLLPCHYTVYKCQFLTEGALTQPLWMHPLKYESHPPCHM